MGTVVFAAGVCWERLLFVTPSKVRGKLVTLCSDYVCTESLGHRSLCCLAEYDGARRGRWSRPDEALRASSARLLVVHSLRLRDQRGAVVPRCAPRPYHDFTCEPRSSGRTNGRPLDAPLLYLLLSHRAESGPTPSS